MTTAVPHEIRTAFVGTIHSLLSRTVARLAAGVDRRANAVGRLKSVRFPTSSTNFDAHAERFAKTIRAGSLDCFDLFGECRLGYPRVYGFARNGTKGK